MSTARRHSENRIEPPLVSAFLSRGFRWYVRRFLRRHFNAVRLAANSAPHLPQDQAVICYGNHPGWWDPLIAVLLNERYFGGRTFYAPIDAQALKSYPAFGRLGFYGIDLQSLDGAKNFLTLTRQLLAQPGSAIWLTPGGRFSDVRERTVFEPGLSHLAHTTDVLLVPLAIEYTFWEERSAEALMEFGRPIRSGHRPSSKRQWQADLEQELAQTQASLAAKSIARRYEEFQILIDGSAGVGGAYDLIRRGICRLRGRRFNPRHRAFPGAEVQL